MTDFNVLNYTPLYFWHLLLLSHFSLTVLLWLDLF